MLKYIYSISILFLMLVSLLTSLSIYILFFRLGAQGEIIGIVTGWFTWLIPAYSISVHFIKWIFPDRFNERYSRVLVVLCSIIYVASLYVVRLLDWYW